MQQRHCLEMAHPRHVSQSFTAMESHQIFNHKPAGALGDTQLLYAKQRKKASKYQEKSSQEIN
jgi:hypothetical protein